MSIRSSRSLRSLDRSWEVPWLPASGCTRGGMASLAGEGLPSVEAGSAGFMSSTAANLEETVCREIKFEVQLEFVNSFAKLNFLLLLSWWWSPLLLWLLLSCGCCPRFCHLHCYHFVIFVVVVVVVLLMLLLEFLMAALHYFWIFW